MSRNIFANITDSEPTESDLRTLVAEKINDSHGLGGMLNLEFSQIEMFASEKRDTVWINMKILTTWVRSETKLPTTWRTLIEALKDIKENRLARKITEKLEQRA